MPASAVWLPSLDSRCGTGKAGAGSVSKIKVGFPGTSEKFRTLDCIAFVNNHLQALAKNEG